MHCDLWRLPAHEEVPAELLCKTVHELREWLGPIEIQIAGGEPLLSKNLVELVRCAKSHDLVTTMTSNGFALTGDKARDLAAAGLDSLALSLDGFTEQHNALRQRPDAFALAERAISHAADNGIAVRINCVICELNIDILPGFVTWVSEHPRLTGVFFQAMMQPFGQPRRERWWLDEKLFPQDPDRAVAVLKQLLSMKISGFPVLNPDEQLVAMASYFLDPERAATARCSVGDFGITIEGTGAIKLCGAFPPIGDLRDRHHLRDVYLGPRAKEVRAQMAACRDNCHLALNCCFDEGVTL